MIVMNDISKMIKRLVRQSAGARNNCPIKIVEGDKPPELLGKSYYYTNKSGGLIFHPAAYRLKYGKPIYRPSTIRVEVGSDWLLNNFTLKNIRLLKLKAFI